MAEDELEHVVDRMRRNFAYTSGTVDKDSDGWTIVRFDNSIKFGNSENAPSYQEAVLRNVRDDAGYNNWQIGEKVVIQVYNNAYHRGDDCPKITHITRSMGR